MDSTAKRSRYLHARRADRREASTHGEVCTVENTGGREIVYRRASRRDNLSPPLPPLLRSRGSLGGRHVDRLLATIPRVSYFVVAGVSSLFLILIPFSLQFHCGPTTTTTILLLFLYWRFFFVFFSFVDSFFSLEIASELLGNLTTSTSLGWKGTLSRSLGARLRFSLSIEFNFIIATTPLRSRDFRSPAASSVISLSPMAAILIAVRGVIIYLYTGKRPRRGHRRVQESYPRPPPPLPPAPNGRGLPRGQKRVPRKSIWKSEFTTVQYVFENATFIANWS